MAKIMGFTLYVDDIIRFFLHGNMGSGPLCPDCNKRMKKTYEMEDACGAGDGYEAIWRCGCPMLPCAEYYDLADKARGVLKKMEEDEK